MAKGKASKRDLAEVASGRGSARDKREAGLALATGRTRKGVRRRGKKR